MTEINWALLADFGEYDAPELEKRQRIRDALAAREREQREQAQPDAAVAARLRITREHGHDMLTQCRECLAKIEAWDAQHAASSNAAPSPQPAARTHSASPQPASSAYSAPVDVLAAAIDAAPDDATRARLLAQASHKLREQFRAMLVYRAMCADDPPDPYAEFSARLDAAADDDARRLLFAECDAAFLAEWRWRRTAGPDDWARRFMTQANPDPMTDY